jgi:hypothetical protein
VRIRIGLPRIVSTRCRAAAPIVDQLGVFRGEEPTHGGMRAGHGGLREHRTDRLAGTRALSLDPWRAAYCAAPQRRAGGVADARWCTQTAVATAPGQRTPVVPLATAPLHGSGLRLSWGVHGLPLVDDHESRICCTVALRAFVSSLPTLRGWLGPMTRSSLGLCGLVRNFAVVSGGLIGAGLPTVRVPALALSEADSDKASA